MKRGSIFIFFLASFLQVAGQSMGKYQIKFLEVNKKNSDYGVAILDENKLIFTSADHKVTSARKNYNPRKDLFVGDIDFDGEIKNVKRVSKEINKNFNQTGVAYTKDKKTVYFSRNKYWKKLKKQNLPKNKRLTLYKADVDEDGNWSNIEKLPFNKNKNSTGYPMLNADDSKLYFVSDRLPSKGNTDIFVVDILDDGNYSKPRNLGLNVNTEGNETTPYITKENILYFSSDGHEGQGKLDVFAVEVFENSTSEVYQLASPINSINDDFAYIVNEDNNQGFFTSNRLQGEGFNDLYSFTLEEDVRPVDCFITVDGKVRDKESYEALSGATVDLYTLEGELIESVSTYNDGTYKFTVSCAKEYQLIASNPNYLDDKKRIEILEENYHTALHTNMDLSRIARKKPAVESLSPIYYEFDAATITQEAAREMDRIVDIMKTNSNLIIEASSFTDSQGSDAYNIELSKRRARAAVEYLKAQGIDESRIRSQGYGEEKLINQCVNGVECMDEAHQMNRRTEFNFVNIPDVGKQKNQSKPKTKVALQEHKQEAQKVFETEHIEKKQEVTEVNSTENLAEEALAANEVAEEETVENVVEVPAEMEKVTAIEKPKTSQLKVAAVDHEITAPVVLKKAVIKEPEAVVKVAEEQEEVAEKEMQTEALAISAEENEEVVEKEMQTEALAISAEEQEEIVEKVIEAPLKETSEIAQNEEISEVSEDHEIENEPEVAAVQEEKSLIEEEKEEYAKLAVATEELPEKEVKEAVIINYNSSIVATNPESNKVLNYIGTEKVKMIEQLTALEKKYEEAIPKYPKLSDSLQVEKGKIAEVITKAKELEETGWSNIIEYKNNVLHFKKRFRDLMVMNGRNRTAGSSSSRAERQLAHAPRTNNDAEQMKVATPIESKVAEMEENLSVDNVRITAMKMNGNGKYQKTNNANKTDLIKVSFKLLSNEKVHSGQKEAHLVLQNPEGIVEEAKGIFKMKDSETETKYTDHAIINYNNHDVDVTMFIQRRGSNFEKGVYPVKVFLEGELMAVTKLDLQNSY